MNIISYMVNRKEIYKCEICGNIVEIINGVDEEIFCCGLPMKLQEANSVDASNEKHVPVIDGKKVIIGSVAHPMGEEHYIEWIEAIGKDGRISKKYLNPNEKPEVEFSFIPISARAYCNLHGLWQSQ